MRVKLLSGLAVIFGGGNHGVKNGSKESPVNGASTLADDGNFPCFVKTHA
jgi:hypothetical protein